MWVAFGPFINLFRMRDYRLPPVSWNRSVKGLLQVKTPHVCLWSSKVAKKPPEWGANVTIGGYTRFDSGSRFAPPILLERFLDTSAQPVIAISFGSAQVSNTSSLAYTIVDAVQQAGVKAVVCGSWASERLSLNQDLSNHVLFIDSVPHSWLLPRVNGFIHHGGAGHTAAGLRCGVPMLIVPFFLDQNFWAARIYQLGLGPAPLDHRGLTANALETSIRDLLSTQYLSRCADMAVQVRAERDGGDFTADIIANELQLSRSTGNCALFSGLRSQWCHMTSDVRLSSSAAAHIVSTGALNWSELTVLPRCDWSVRLKTAECFTVEIFSIISYLVYQLGYKAFVFLGWMKCNLTGARPNLSATGDPIQQVRIHRAVSDMNYIEHSINIERCFNRSDISTSETTREGQSS